MINKNKIYFIIFFSALVLGYYQTLRIDSPNYELKQTRHSSIVNNSIEYPYKYRLLNPYIANIWFTAFKKVVPEKPAFLAAYFLQNLLVFGFMLFAVNKFFSLWLSNIAAILSLILFALIVPVTLTGYDVLGDMTTAGIMALGFYFISAGKEKYLFPLVFIAAFNELQAVLLAAFYFFASGVKFTDKKLWLNSVLIVIIFTAAYGLIYLLRGGYAGGGEVQWYFTKDAEFNIANKDWILLWGVLITPLLFMAFKNFKAKPLFLKRSAVIVLPLFYFMAFFFIARLREIDKALTIFIILIPLAVYSLFPDRVKESSEN